MNLHCIAIDDEPMALQIIARFCERFGHISLETYTNPVAGMSQVRKRKPDVLLGATNVNAPFSGVSFDYNGGIHKSPEGYERDARRLDTCHADLLLLHGGLFLWAGLALLLSW